MATQITINAVGGGFLSYPLVNPPVPVQLDIVPAPGGGVLKAWTLYRPRGSTAVLSNPAIQNPTFDPDVEGTYRLALTLDGVPDDGAVCVVPHYRIGARRVPAQGETTQASASEGWAIGPNPAGQNDQQDFLIRHHAQGGLMLCRAGEVLNVGNGVRCTGAFLEKSGLPGAETVPVVMLSDTSTVALAMQTYGVLVEKVTPGGGAVALGDHCLVQLCGPAHGVLNTLGHAVGDSVCYTDVAGVLGFSPGTVLVFAGVVSTVGAVGSITVKPAWTDFGMEETTVTTAEAISKYDMVTADGHKVDATNIAHKGQVLGMAAANALIGTTLVVWTYGYEMTNAGWAWTGTGKPIFCHPTISGGLTETEPSGAGPYFDLQVGVSTGPNSLFLVEKSPLWVPA